MSSSNSPCAACKLRRQKCTQECVFAPYFPPDQPQKFANVHEVFGASNVAKLLNELNAAQREDAVNSLAYEAAARLRDPVYGCVGLISILQHKLRLVQQDLSTAKKELSTYIGASPVLPVLPHPAVLPQHLNNPSSSAVLPYNMPQMLALQMGQSHGGGLLIREPQHPHLHHHQMLEAQQLAAVATAREQQEMLRSFEQQQQHQHHEIVRFTNEFDVAGQVGFNQMAGTAMSPSLALGSFDNHYQIEQQSQEHPHHHLQLQPQSQEHPHHQLQLLPQEPHHHHLQLQPQQLLLEHEQEQPQQPHAQTFQRSGSEEGGSTGPC